jgi:hypothetical protein
MEWARIALRFGYLPLLLIGWNGLPLLVVERGASRAWLPLLLVLAIGPSFIAERILLYEVSWNRARGDNGHTESRARTRDAGVPLPGSIAFEGERGGKGAAIEVMFLAISHDSSTDDVLPRR